jgi:hypothetical protein
MFEIPRNIKFVNAMQKSSIFLQLVNRKKKEANRIL